MKIKLIILLVYLSSGLANPILSSAKYEKALEAIFGIGVRLQALLTTEQNKADNFIVSPVSLTAIIAQLMLGAEGKFRDDLYNLLSISNSSHDKHTVISINNKSVDLPYANLHVQLSSLLSAFEKRAVGSTPGTFKLHQKNALFHDRNILLKPFFTNLTKILYNTQVQDLDFQGNSLEAQKTINEWVIKHTNGLIREVFNIPPPPSTSAILLNAIYFHAEWQQPFSDELNRNDTFYVNKNQTVQTTFMLGNLDQIPYAETDTYKLVCLPYKKDELGMFIILPKDGVEHEYNIKQFVTKLKSSEVLAAMEKLKLKDVVVKIPKLSLSSRISILKPLQRYNKYIEEVKKKKRVFIESRNKIDALEERVKEFKNYTVPPLEYSDIWLENAAINSTLRISDIIQEMRFNINEKGTEAAAVSLGSIDYIGGQKNLRLNKPFIFFIQHLETTATLFWGTISNPTKN